MSDPKFTERDKQLATLWMEGKTAFEIAQTLDMSEVLVTWTASQLRARGVPLPKRSRKKGKLQIPRTVTLDEMCAVVGAAPLPRTHGGRKKLVYQCAAYAGEDRCHRTGTRERSGYAVCVQHQKNLKLRPHPTAVRRDNDVPRLKTEFVECCDYWKEPES